ncbi:MAG: ABC transporter ATP-binding protein [Gammaproteobacteria bacterium]|nr:ABC transporter ATP-binding protein [Gammaproteobacteria bacterium]
MGAAQFVLENVAKRFGNQVAVNPMNLEIRSGEFLAIMGPSGCGKTTTLRMLAGLEAPSEGEIRLNGVRINEFKPHERETPMVWQSLALFPFLNVRENVEFGLKMRGVPKAERAERAHRWLQRLEIDQFAERDIGNLSGGQRQRVALARALVTEPPVLLLDEPLSALDANLVVRMQTVLIRLQKELGITFVYVTHSQSEAFAMADRIVIMNAGSVEQVGTPREIYRAPTNRFVAEFVGTNNIIEGTVSSHKAGMLECDTALGCIRTLCGENNPIHPGNRVDLVIGADLIEVSAEPIWSDNCFPAAFIGEEFVGSVATLHFETESGDEIRVQKQQRETESLELAHGKPLYLHWDADTVYCLASRTSDERGE